VPMVLCRILKTIPTEIKGVCINSLGVKYEGYYDCPTTWFYFIDKAILKLVYGERQLFKLT